MTSKDNLLLEGKIINYFRGWAANAIFEFENGEVWKQMDYQFYNIEAYNPIAKIIERNGFYFLEVNGHETQIRRIK